MIKALIFLVLIFITFSFYVLVKKSEKNIFLISIVTISIIIFVLIYFFFFNENNKENLIYIPPIYDGEKVIPGYFDEKD